MNPLHLAKAIAGKVGVTPRLVADISGRRRITQEQMGLLEVMVADNAKSRPPFVATTLWQQLARRLDDYLWWDGLDDVESSRLNGYFAGTEPGEPKLLRFAAYMLHQHIKAKDDLGLLSRIASSAAHGSRYALEIEGKRFTWELLLAVDHFLSAREVTPGLATDPVVVLELGAGWGRFGYVLKTANPSASYIICDLPQALLVSSTYLPRKLPEARIHPYIENRQKVSFDRASLADGGVHFLGAHHLDLIADKSVDLFVNIASFQEMTQDQVAAYLAVANRIVGGSVYTCQLWKSTTHTWSLDEIAGFDSYQFPQSWKRSFVRNPAWTDLFFEAGFRFP